MKTYQWMKQDPPLTQLAREAAKTVGLTYDTYRAGKAIKARAPWHILKAWELEELTTQEAYEALKKWEGQ
jgi:hypothetical protein